MIARSPALLVSVLILTTVSTTAGFIVSPGGYLSPLASPPLIGATGGINGSIFMGNIYPTCRISPIVSAAPSYYNEIGLVITHSAYSDLPLTVPVTWVLLYGCTLRGTFKVGLNPGAYSLTLTSCSGVHMGVESSLNGFLCSRFPMIVTVDSGTWTQVTVSITTGIY